MLPGRISAIALAFTVVSATLLATDNPATEPLISKTLVEVAHSPAEFYFSGRVPEWSGGALVAADHERGPHPTVALVGRDGRTLSRFVFEIPETGTTRIYGFARGPGGTLALAGSASSEDSKWFSYLSILSAGGQLQQTIRLKPFSPQAVAIASDGTIWVAGSETAEGNSDHRMIRRYSPSGKELGAYLPRSGLKTAWDHPAADSFLVSARGRIGWYSNPARQYIEFSLDGQVSARIAGPTKGEDDRVTGVGLCDDGTLYASVFTISGDSEEQRWTVLTLNRGNGTWEPVLVKPDVAASGTQVYGCDGTDLVMHSRQPGELKGLSWFRPLQ